MGIEPTTSSMRMRRSTDELLALRKLYGYRCNFTLNFAKINVLGRVAERFTRRSQKPLGVIPCGFESHLAHGRKSHHRRFVVVRVLKVVRLLEPEMCEDCRFAHPADVQMADRSVVRMIYCRRLDCDNWDWASAELARAINLEAEAE